MVNDMLLARLMLAFRIKTTIIKIKNCKGVTYIYIYNVLLIRSKKFDRNTNTYLRLRRRLINL